MNVRISRIASRMNTVYLKEQSPCGEVLSLAQLPRNRLAVLGRGQLTIIDRANEPFNSLVSVKVVGACMSATLPGFLLVSQPASGALYCVNSESLGLKCLIEGTQR